MSDQPTRPSNETRDEEARDAQVAAGADKTGGPDASDDAKVDKSVREHEQEMAKRGAEAKGEGRLP